MRIISAIDDRQVIRAILEHLGLWLVRSKPLPKPIWAFGGDILWKPAGSATYSRNETHADAIYGDPEYTWDEYIES